VVGVDAWNARLYLKRAGRALLEAAGRTAGNRNRTTGLGPTNAPMPLAFSRQHHPSSGSPDVAAKKLKVRSTVAMKQRVTGA
jgi:hypothetical protein